jgi:hypothetical protein
MNWFSRLFHKAIENENPYPKMGEVKRAIVEPIKYQVSEHPAFKPVMKNQKAITPEAIAEANLLLLPDMKKAMRRPADEDWTKAFAWYNKHIHIGQYPLSTMCAPCWNKIHIALQKAQTI